MKAMCSAMHMAKAKNSMMDAAMRGPADAMMAHSRKRHAYNAQEPKYEQQFEDQI